MTEDEFRNKFMNMAGRVLGDTQSDQLYDQARRLERIGNVADLAALFSPK